MNLAAFVFAFVLINLSTGKREVVNAPEARARKSPYPTYIELLEARGLWIE